MKSGNIRQWTATPKKKAEEIKRPVRRKCIVSRMSMHIIISELPLTDMVANSGLKRKSAAAHAGPMEEGNKDNK